MIFGQEQEKYWLRKREGLIPPRPATWLEPLLESAHFFLFPCRKHFLAITGGQSSVIPSRDTIAQAPEFLPSTVKVSRPSLLPPQSFRVQCTVPSRSWGDTRVCRSVWKKKPNNKLEAKLGDLFSTELCKWRPLNVANWFARHYSKGLSLTL